MYVLFFLIWVIFNGQVTTEIVLFGLVISAVVYAFACRFIGWSFRKDLWAVKRIGLILRYVWLLLTEILKANLATSMAILSYEKEPHPVLVRFRTKLRSRITRVLLANSITLTPGTITVALEGDELTVHCLDESMSLGLENSAFEQLLLKMEGRE